MSSPSLYPHLYEAPLTGPKIKLTGIAEKVISFDDSEKASVPILFGDEHKGFHLSCNRKVKVNCGEEPSLEYLSGDDHHLYILDL